MNITICDICKREISLGRETQIRVWAFGSLRDGEYCEKCWREKKNWPKIHGEKVEKK